MRLRVAVRALYRNEAELRVILFHDIRAVAAAAHDQLFLLHIVAGQLKMERDLGLACRYCIAVCGGGRRTAEILAVIAEGEVFSPECSGIVAVIFAGLIAVDRNAAGIGVDLVDQNAALCQHSADLLLFSAEAVGIRDILIGRITDIKPRVRIHAVVREIEIPGGLILKKLIASAHFADDLLGGAMHELRECFLMHGRRGGNGCHRADAGHGACFRQG